MSFNHLMRCFRCWSTNAKGNQLQKRARQQKGELLNVNGTFYNNLHLNQLGKDLNLAAHTKKLCPDWHPTDMIWINCKTCAGDVWVIRIDMLFVLRWMSLLMTNLCSWIFGKLTRIAEMMLLGASVHQPRWCWCFVSPCQIPEATCQNTAGQ